MAFLPTIAFVGEIGTPGASVKKMRLRYAGQCCRCGAELAAGLPAFYDRTAKVVFCIQCPGVDAEPRPEEVLASQPGPDFAPTPDAVEDEPAAEPEPELGVAEGVPGGGARREFERRSAKREARVRTNHPKIGGLLLALVDNPQSTKAWAQGATGEERLGNRLTQLAGPSLRVLHDRGIPRSRANIDHIAVCPTGVYVIDAKRYVDKRPELRHEGGLLSPRVDHLYVGGRLRDHLVDGVIKQVGLVRTALGGDAVPVHGVLCFIEADFPVIGGSFAIRDVNVAWPRKLYAALAEPGPLDEASIADIHRQLAHAFPAAAN